jgi:glycerol-3-phosphate dehydrogenase
LQKEFLEQYDIAIIGAGIAGAAVARELSKYKLSVVILEKEAEVCFGATKGTHAIVHCGLPEAGAPLKNRGELLGNLKMEQLCKELDVPFKRVGKLLVAFNSEEKSILKMINLQAKRNGVLGVELVTDKKKMKEMEPQISDEIIAALYTPTTAIASPWGLVYGLIENAQANGVRLYVSTPVTAIDANPGKKFLIYTPYTQIQASYIINAAGINADKVAQMVNDASFTLTGERQQRIVIDKRCDGMVKHVVRSLRGKSPSGDFVMPTVDGDILVGSKEDVVDYPNVKTTRAGIEEWIIPRYLKLIPNLDPINSIKPFAGYIPVAGDDYNIKPAPNQPQFINMVLGGSGFTAAIAMAQYLVEEVLPTVGLKLEENSNFNPYREDIPHISELSNTGKTELIAKDPRYGHMVCRCESVTEGEIIEAIRRGARTMGGIKFRTRAGMGRCQGGFCRIRVLKILSRELGVSVKEITSKGTGSTEILYYTKELLKV